MNLIAPFGFYGWGNIGDESTLQGFARLISLSGNGMRVWVASRNPTHTRRVEPSFRYFAAVGRDIRRRWARFRSQACVVPGGTPVMDVLGSWPLSELEPLISAAHEEGKPVIFVGTGTEKLEREESRRLFSESIAPKVLHWSVRCDRDKERLIDYGVAGERVTVAADLAWMLREEPADFGRKYLERLGVDLNRFIVGVNVNGERFALKKEPELFEKLAAFLDAVIETSGATVLFLCNEVREEESFDKASHRKIIQRMKRGDRAVLVPNRYWSPREMLSLVGCCHQTISTRYHFCLFSALQKVPFIALKRSGKVDDLCWDTGWKYGTPLEDLSPSALFQMSAAIREERESLAGELEAVVFAMRRKAEENQKSFQTLCISER